jgi:RHS repeat-associated protein
LFGAGRSKFLITGSAYDGSRSRTVTSAINRFYDPATDQFLSIDPDIAETDQPYVFTNDDPLNTEDPLGLKVVDPSPTKSTSSASYAPTVKNVTVGVLGGTLATTYSANTVVLVAPSGTSLKITSEVSILGPGSVSNVSVSVGGVSVSVSGSSPANFSASVGSVSVSGSSISYSYSGSQSVGHGSNSDTVSVNVTVSFQQGGGSSFSGDLERGLAAVTTLARDCAEEADICFAPAGG